MKNREIDVLAFVEFTVDVCEYEIIGKIHVKT